MYLEVITPEKKLFTGEVQGVKVPGIKGSFEMLNNHAPIISLLEKGKIRIKTAQGEKLLDVNGGIVEMMDNKVVILTE